MPIVTHWGGSVSAGSRSPEEPAVVVLGGGGHAVVVIDACQALGRSVAGVLDPGLEVDTAVLGAPLLGDDARIEDPAFVEGHEFHLGVAECGVRTRLAGTLQRYGARAATLCHPAATVSAHAQLAPGCFVAAGAVVGARARLGAHALVNTGASVDHDCTVGGCTHVAPGARLCGFVRCGDGVLVGSGASVVPSCSLGDGCIVGAGAAVLKDVSAGTTVAGVPARPAR
jgi:UDP-perosamine 4-acetyltransferase